MIFGFSSVVISISVALSCLESYQGWSYCVHRGYNKASKVKMFLAMPISVLPCFIAKCKHEIENKKNQGRNAFAQVVTFNPHFFLTGYAIKMFIRVLRLPLGYGTYFFYIW